VFSRFCGKTDAPFGFDLCGVSFDKIEEKDGSFRSYEAISSHRPEMKELARTHLLAAAETRSLINCFGFQSRFGIKLIGVSRNVFSFICDGQIPPRSSSKAEDCLL
jgi:hypothetical protein